MWSPFLYTVNLLIPIVDLGHDGKWRPPKDVAWEQQAQWISSGLIAAGWILATTAAAGITRMLRRN